MCECAPVSLPEDKVAILAYATILAGKGGRSFIRILQNFPNQTCFSRFAGISLGKIGQIWGMLEQGQIL